MSLFGGIVKGLGSIATSVIKASPLGTVITTAAGLLHPSAPAGPTVLGNLPTVFTGTPVQPPPPRQVTAPMLPALSPAAAGGGIVKGNNGQEDHGLVITNRAAAGQHGHYTKKGTWSPRRRPRMNPMNVRAARKAVRRIHSAEKLFRRILSVSHPGKATGHISPKRSKRRA